MSEKLLCRIEALDNGFEVEINDPAVVKANVKSKGPWRNPMRTFAFKTCKEVVDFLKTNLEKAMPGDDEYDSAFAELTEEKGEEDD